MIDWEVLGKWSWENRHTRQRFRERYGIDYNRPVRLYMTSQIQQGKAQFLRRRSKRRSIWKLIFQKQPVIVVYDCKRSNIITCLPLLNDRGLLNG